MMRALVVVAMLMFMSACASVTAGPDGQASYRYNTFDFSGDSWGAQKRRCEMLGMNPRHLGTDCGFWTCVSRYDCQTAQ